MKLNGYNIFKGWPTWLLELTKDQRSINFWIKTSKINRNRTHRSHRVCYEICLKYLHMYVLWKNDFKTESSRIYSSDHNRSNEMSGRATLTAAYKTKKLAHYLIYLLIDTWIKKINESCFTVLQRKAAKTECIKIEFESTVPAHVLFVQVVMCTCIYIHPYVHTCVCHRIEIESRKHLAETRCSRLVNWSSGALCALVSPVRLL